MSLLAVSRRNKLSLVSDLEILEVNSQLAQLQSGRKRLESLLAKDQRAEYNAAVPGFNAQVSVYNAAVRSVQNMIAEYNALVNTRNELAKEIRDLVGAIDTRATPQQIQ